MALAILAAYAMLFMSFAAPAAHAERGIAANTAGSICGSTAGRNAPAPAPLQPEHGDCVCPATCAAAFVLAADVAIVSPEPRLRDAALTKIAAQLPQPRHAAYPGQAHAPPRGVQTYR